MPLSRGGRAVWHWEEGAVMRNSSTEEEKDTVGSVLCKQLYQMCKCKFLQNFVNTRMSDVLDSCAGFEIDESGGEGYRR